MEDNNRSYNTDTDDMPETAGGSAGDTEAAEQNIENSTDAASQNVETGTEAVEQCVEDAAEQNAEGCVSDQGQNEPAGEASGTENAEQGIGNSAGTADTDSDVSSRDDSDEQMSDEEAEKKYRPYIGGRNVTEPRNTSYYKRYVEENEKKLDEESARPDHGYRNRWTSLIILVVVIALYMLYTMVLKDNVNCAGDEAKTRLEGTVDVVGYVSTWESDGEDGWTATSETSAWTVDVDNLVYIMDDFYSTTGVRVYILDLSNEDVMTAEELQAAADEFYEETFEDERHFLIAFQSTSEAIAAYHVGDDAAEIMDSEAIETFDEYLKSYFGNDDYDESDVFIYVFSDASNTIMNGNARTALLILVIAVMLIYGVFASYKNLKKNSASDKKDAASGR